MSNLIFDEKDNTVFFSPNNNFDWNNVDFVCIKAKEGMLRQAIYILDGHSLYDKNITPEDRKFVDFIRKIGCYGNSEKVISADRSIDQFYVKTNIENTEQQNKIINYLCSNNMLSNCQQELLTILKNLERVIDVRKDYKPLYYCGFMKQINDSEYSQIRFYFKIFSADEDVRFDKECVQYLESFDVFKFDSMFEVVKKLVFSKKAGLRCIGLECGKSNSIKLKYYLCESGNGKSLTSVLFELPRFSQLEKNGLLLLKKIDSFQGYQYQWIQIAKEFAKEDADINLYLEPLYRKKKKYYQLKVGIVLRNIGGIWFLIDIHEKHYYEYKNLFVLNEVGKLIVEFLFANKVCTLDGMVSYIKSRISNYIPELNSTIYNDCNSFITRLIEKGFLLEVT